jgi:hypothetical protein
MRISANERSEVVRMQLPFVDVSSHEALRYARFPATTGSMSACGCC